MGLLLHIRALWGVRKMAYLVYLSEGKLDMLYEQDYKATAETETEGELKIGLFTGTVKKKKDNKPNRFTKLERVTTALMDKIGSPFDDEVPSYITDTLSMAWKVLGDCHDATYWVGEGEKNGIKAIVLLIGSSKNTIGANANASTTNVGVGYSHIASFADAFLKETEGENHNVDEGYPRGDMASLVYSAYCGSKTRPSIWIPYRFLAKCLVHENSQYHGESYRLILATPLFVEQAD